MLTKKQKEVLDFLNNYVKNKGYAPSLEEIRTHFKLASISTAHYFINKLKEEGYLEKASNKSRSINIYPDEKRNSVLSKKIESFLIPILGLANAGPATIFAEENINGYLKISRNNLKTKDGIFALRVKGDSMNKAKINGKNIEEGDFVLIDSNYKNPVDGDYVLSVIDECANLKRFKKDSKTKDIQLLSESKNSKHKPIHISSEDNFAINGKIILVFKK
jgi:repressor LexA